MAVSYRNLSDRKATRIIEAFGQPVLIQGDVIRAIYVYPTEEQVLVRSGGSSEASSLRAMMRIPELYLHKKSGQFKKGNQARVLCRPGSPDLMFDRFDYNEGWIYRVSLVEAQEKPADTAGRKWQ